MFRKFFLKFLLALLLTVSSASALTDPEPNPFASPLAGEKVFTATVTEVSAEILSVKNSDGVTSSGRMEAIAKYRDGGGPAAAGEFFPGDNVRVLVNAQNVILAAQDSNLLLCDQNFYGWVREPTATTFTLETVEGEKYTVLIGSKTQFRDENSKILFGYAPRADDVVKIHGVVNTNVRQIFTETFGAYISLLDENALAPFLAALAEKKAAAAAELAKKLAEQVFDDVSPDAAFFYAINFIANEKIVAGYDDGNFKPGAEMNRAEFTKILIQTRFADELADFKLSEKCFPDVELTDWFAPFVCFAKANGIIGGYPDGEFKPANPVNLAEAITILVQAFDFSVEKNSATEWFAPYLQKAQQLQILPTDFAAANANLTRGKMAELVMRALKYTRGELVDYLENLPNAN